MPASLLSLKLRGVRSYSSYEHKTQSIDFMPLTLIVGSNGNGKTTIIESLKFIISGEEPPLSDCRRNFLHTPTGKSEILDKRTSQACIELHFQSTKNEFCVAKREMFAPIAKNATPCISSSYKVAPNTWINVHKQDDWSRTIPMLFNLPSQAMLNNVILCHQEENLWCMGDSSTVKQIFDKIFGCEQYKKEIKNIETEIKTCKSELLLGEKDLAHDREKVERKRLLNNQLEAMKIERDKITAETLVLNKEIEVQQERIDSISKEMTKLENQKGEISMYKNRIQEAKQNEAQLRQSLKTPLIDPQDVSDEELNQKMKDHYNLFDATKKRQDQLQRKNRLLESELNDLEKRKLSLQDEINRLKVMDLRLKDTNETLVDLLKKVKIEQSVEEIIPENIEASLRALTKFEKVLQQNKSEQSELEDRLSLEHLKLGKSINKLDALCQSYLQTIRNKESYLETLNDHLAQTDPVGKDLLAVTQNLEKMSSITKRIPQSEFVTSLVELINQSSTIMDSLVNKITKDGVMKIQEDISRETKGIQESKISLEEHQKLVTLQSEKHSQVEAEHAKVRSMSKESHNTLLKFKNQQLQVINYYDKYSCEKKLFDSRNMSEKVEQLKEVEEQIKSKREELSSSSAEHLKLADEIRESYDRYDGYQQNISIRDIIHRSKLYADKLATLEDDTELEKNLEKLNSRYSEENKMFLELRDKRSSIGGSKTQISCQMDRLCSELKGITRVGVKYAENLGKVVCNKIMLSDLEKLKECFQHSIITFHNQMIVKINEVLRIRWRQIYRGNDIDHIELVDEEITRGKDKKAFNYYIAMRKGNVRMKMREKSSAGQRALASIILRMTLAELFVKDFAFIALDEPTANLDHANVQSLAKAIGSYVKRRADRGVNIQWIIISHNEQFIKALNAECSPHYYKVQLDDEGCSKIVKIAYQEIPNEVECLS